VAGSSKYGDEPSGSGATELELSVVFFLAYIQTPLTRP
jgi:hypothetical protein